MMFSHPDLEHRKHDLDSSGLSDVSFGKDMRKEFGLHPDLIFYNHGGYGAVPVRVLQLQYRYNLERETHPDIFIRVSALKYFHRARAEIASRINAQVDNVTIVENATTALNCTLRAFPLQAGDGLLDTTHTYEPIKLMSTDFTARLRPDVERYHLDLKLPIQSEDSVVDAYREVLERHPNIKLAIIDHITSPTSILLPVARLCQLLHAHGVTVVVDGAHTFGHVALDVQALGADVYVSNIHKWGYSPRGAALIWFSDQSSRWIRPPNTSEWLGKGLGVEFYQQGTRDHVPSICALHGIQFHDAIGGLEKTLDYSSKLASQGKQLLQDIGMEPIAVPLSMEAPRIKMLKFPPMKKYPYTEANAWRLQRDLFADSNIYGLVFLFDNAFWLRLCIAVYNDLDEIKALARLIQAFIEKNKNKS